MIQKGKNSNGVNL